LLLLLHKQGPDPSAFIALLLPTALLRLLPRYAASQARLSKAAGVRYVVAAAAAGVAGLGAGR